MFQSLLLWFGYGLCHQLPERSYFGGSFQVPVCARDTGIYVGFVASLVAIAWLQKSRPSGFPSAPVAIMLGAFVLLMAADGVSSYAGLRQTTNEFRLATGLLAGYAMGAVAAPLINDEFWRRSSAERVLGDARTVVVWLASVVTLFALILWGAPALGVAYALLVVACILATLTAVNLLLVCMLRRFERRAERLRDGWLPLAIAFALAWAEVAASAGMKVGFAKLLGA